MAAANDCPHQNILQKEDSTNKKRYRLLELYCGIGGMRYALDSSGIPYEVVAAVDIDPVAGAIYKHNFGSEGHYEKDILSFTSSDIENMKIDIITMSPSCQPFPRFGIKDFERITYERNKSFLHILTILKELQRKPMYIVVGNAMGFDSSHAKKVLLETLEASGYRYQHFYLTPQPFGFPNSRCWNYVIAKLREEKFSFIESRKPLNDMPDVKYDKLERPEWIHDNIVLHPLGFFLETEIEDLERYLISDRILLKSWSEFDIVDGNSTNSTRFTKGYHHLAQRSGSVISSVEAGEVH
ncbi:tRNA (cytosine(38)-C(5))-methyltransferase-like isoform X2 [Argiope bruennichi]|uniref:tRNA (Cytosine(38)-C(5))-methyltransferase like protein n=1 Tax=Argiope bruennichi TaxID=94029 RepID=A0A8T0F2Y3_ARGBR|nr:tRNA (cytosine(38)-C(5))-methyltransferase-like isoform X2 [Argiope bruennichi]KAF8784675.1 tRNA (cytosine(38)-C(5))-methyltransferase like protein [Argiope bruennichi]